MLEQGIKIGKMQLANRLVMAPLCLDKSDRGRVSEALLRHYDERTREGCVGLAVIEHCFVREDGRFSENQLSIARDKDVAGFRKLAETIHKNGCKTIVQISHAGGTVPQGMYAGEAISPSGIANPLWKKQRGELASSRAMTKEDIREIVECFVKAALRVKAAGFDGVMIHAAHGYLLNQFYSPLTNKRTDEYSGATLEGRTLLTRQIIQAVRMVVGEDFPLVLRFGGCDYAAGGSLIGDAVQAALMYQEAGIDAIDMSGGLCFFTREGRNDPGYFSDLSGPVKKAVSIPVILAGGVKTREDAEKLLADGKADMISVGRALAADPGWAGKIWSQDR